MTGIEPTRTASNVPGRIGFIVAIILVAYNLVVAMIAPAISLRLSFDGMSATAVGVLFTSISLLGILLALTATIFGIVGASKAGAPKLLAGIALGVGVPAVLVGVVSIIAPMLSSLAF